MTQKLSPWIRQQFFDNNGDPLAGGFVYFYVAGSTSIFKNTYEDYLGSVNNENPVQLDSSGVAKIFGSGMYDVVIKDSNGVLIETVRGVDFGGSSSEFGSYIVVSNYAALRGLSEDYDAVYVLGRDVPNDGGQGMFLHSTKTDADDDGIILVRNSASRYFRVLDETVNPLWYGCKYSQAIDNSSAFTSTINGGIAFNLPVSVDGALYFSSNYSIKSGARIILNGSFYGVTGISITFKNGSKLISANKNSFASSINPIFEDGVSDYLKVSWFAGSIYQAIKTSVENYSLLVDKDTTIDQNLTVPLNFALDFVGGSKFIVKNPVDLIVNTLKYSDVGQIIVYQSKSYIQKVMLGQGYCYLEWFGGYASSSLDSGNSIAFTAALAHGKIYLVSNAPEFYNIPAGAYANSNGLVLFGNYVPNNSNVNDSVQSTIRFSTGTTLTVGNLTVNGVKIEGNGTIVATKTVVQNSIISNTISIDSKLTKVNDILATNASFITVGIYGRVGRTNNVNGSWTPITTGYSVNINSIAKGKSLFVACGQNGLVTTSPDGFTWTQRASNISTNLNEVKWIEATQKFIAVGDSGKLIHSTNGIDWNTVSTALTTIRSVAYFNGKYVIVGDSGKIYTSSDLSSWTLKVATGVTGILYSVEASSTLLTIVGYNGIIVTSTDASTFTLRIGPTLSNLFTVKYYNDSSTWVAAGANGTILKSLDGISYSQIKTYTDSTDSIFDQTMANAEYVFVGGSGKIITSYDLVNFVASTPMSAQDFYGIAESPATVLTIGDAGTISASLDGFNYTTLTSGTTENLNRIKQIGDYYFICANNGKYLYSQDRINWTIASVASSTKNLMDVVVNSNNTLYTVVGSNGLVATSANPFIASPVWVIENIYSTGTTPLTTNILDIVYDASQAVYKYTLVGEGGTNFTSTDSHTWTTHSSGSATYRIFRDGTDYWSVGIFTGASTYAALYKGTNGVGGSYVETSNTKFARVTKVGSNIVLFGAIDNSVIESSSNSFTTKTFNELNSNDYTITGITTVLLNGNDMTLFSTSSGKVLIGQVIPSTLTATEISLLNSIVGIEIVNTIGGEVTQSKFQTMTVSEKVIDSTATRFNGSINTLISRSTIEFINSININENCFIGDSTLVNINEDKNIGVFSVDSTVTGISINNTTINSPKSLLVYSENTSLKININGGVIYNGNGIALSNGFAKVFTNGVFDENADILKNVSAYSIEGNILEAELTEIEAPLNITSSKDHWYGEVAKVDLEGDHFKTNAPIYLSSQPNGATTLRYRFGSDALRAIRSFGGRIKTTIKFPAGADKVEQLASRVKALFYIPSYTVDCYDYNTLAYRNGTNDRFTAGKTLAGSSSVDGATIINYTNVWAGREALMQQLPVTIPYDAYRKNVCRDEWNDYSFEPYLERTYSPLGYAKSNYLFGTDRTYTGEGGIQKTLDGDLTFEAYIVIVNESIAALPVGTTIKVELIPSLPKTIDTFNAFFEAPQYAVDSYNGREKQFLQFRDFSTGDLKLAFRAKSTSVTWDVALYKTAPNYYYNFTPASGPEGQFASTYDPKSKLWDLLVDVKIDIENLNWTGAQTIPKYHFSPAYDPEYYTASQIFTLP